MRHPQPLVGQFLSLDPVVAHAMHQDYSVWVRTGWTGDAVSEEQKISGPLHEYVRPGVALLKFSGVTVMEQWSTWGPEIVYATLERAIEEAFAALATAHLVVQLESPGGFCSSLLASCERIRRITSMRKIPVSVHTQGQCTSAGAILAAAICSNKRGRITSEMAVRVGNIGMYRLLTFTRRALEEAGIDVRYVAAGSHKVDLFPELPPDDQAFKREQAQVEEIYEAICRAVGLYRSTALGISPEEGYRLVRGQDSRTYIGNQEAIDNGVIDAVMTLDQVLDEAADAV